MFKETKEIVEFMLKKIEEMRKNYPNGIPIDWKPEDIEKMTKYNLAITVTGATQFYTIERAFISEEKAKEGLDLFFNNAKEDALKMIDEREQYYRREKEKILNG